eukprot:TRINITY_DN40562_c0_g1_i1.p1 TRINITY_DN40562_c0_g1~~TRINITY_DN40562_c0_g1_i1.p1  ORF type:complete len:261 (+),score=23.26 TRINITY_DN40562_c0_g1_i1:47-784(+)
MHYGWKTRCLNSLVAFVWVSFAAFVDSGNDGVSGTSQTSVWHALLGHTVLLLHASKTGGSSSKHFMNLCMQHDFDDNIMSSDYWTTFSRLWNPRLRTTGGQASSLGVFASHVMSEHHSHTIFSSLPENFVGVIPVRPWRSWFVSAMQDVARGLCLENTKTFCPDVARRNGLQPCIIDQRVLLHLLRRQHFELWNGQERLFAGLWSALKSRKLKGRVFFFRLSQVGIVVRVPSTEQFLREPYFQKC